MRPIRTVLAIGMLAIAVVAPARAEPAGFSSSGGPCFQGALALAVPAKNLRPFVPSDFPLVGAAGRATIFIYTVSCEAVSIDGGTPRDLTFTGVAAFVLPPDGSPGVQAYDILMTVDDQEYFDHVTALGLEQGLVEVGFKTKKLAGPIVSVSANTPWEHSPYSWTLVAVKPPPYGIPLPTVHWQDGALGRVRTDDAHTNLILAPGVGRVTASPGSPLAQILGAESATGAGGILRFSYSQELVLGA